jgi:peptide methionine sulfoxide reductase MsrA
MKSSQASAVRGGPDPTEYWNTLSAKRASGRSIIPSSPTNNDILLRPISIDSNRRGVSRGIVTAVVLLKAFYRAEYYHQD